MKHFWPAWSLLHKTLYHTQCLCQWNWQADVSLSISLQFSQGKLRPECWGVSQCNNRRRRDAYFSWIRRCVLVGQMRLSQFKDSLFIGCKLPPPHPIAMQAFHIHFEGGKKGWVEIWHTFWVYKTYIYLSISDGDHNGSKAQAYFALLLLSFSFVTVTN